VDLTGRAIVVVGAGGGIGAACVASASAVGATVVAADRDGAAAAAAGEAGGAASAHVVDIVDEASVRALAARVIADHGRIHGWVNSAGVMRGGSTLEMTRADFEAVLAVNLTGTLLGCQAAGRHMVANGGGAIVNVASAILDGPQAGMAAYGVSKAGVSHLSRTLAAELGPSGVRVNVVAPGWTRTAMTEASARGRDGGIDEDILDRTAQMMARFTPLGRVAEPADAADAVAWLLSDAARFITGQTIRPHGGVTLPW